MYTQRLKLGGVEVAVSLHGGLAQKIRENALYRYLLRPVIKGFGRLVGGVRDLVRPLTRRRPAPVPSAKASQEQVDSPERRALLDRIEGVEWYHCIDLGHGVVTPGVFDLIPDIPYYHLPDRLDGMRVLDAATFNGFWALEFERRGAAEVVAMDLEKVADLDLAYSVRAEKPPEELNRKLGIGFDIVRDVRQSKIKKEICNLYDLSPERLGMFDMVFSGDVLLHIQNPAKALANLRKVTKGFAIIADVYDPNLDKKQIYNAMSYIGGKEFCVWWQMSRMALETMIRDAGFSKVEILDTFTNHEINSTIPIHHIVFKATP